MLQNLGKKGGKKMQLHTFQCKSLILVRKRGRKHCFGGSLLEIEFPEWKCENNQGPEAGGVAPKLLLSAGAEPSGAVKWLLEVPTWERWEQGHGAEAVLWHTGVLISLGQQVWGENTWIQPDGDLPARQKGAASVPGKGGGWQGAGMGHSSTMGEGVSLGKPFPLLWAVAQMG